MILYILENVNEANLLFKKNGIEEQYECFYHKSGRKYNIYKDRKKYGL